MSSGCRDQEATKNRNSTELNETEKLNYTDRHGLKQGPWEIYSNDILVAKGTYMDDKEEGVWMYWYENGNKRAEGNFKKGEKIGMWVEWYDDDVLMWKGTWKNGKRVVHYEGDKPIIRFLDKEVSNNELSANTEYRIQIRIPGIPVQHQFIEAVNGEILKTESPDTYVLKTGKTVELTLVIGYYPDKNLLDYRDLIEKRNFIVHVSDPPL